MLSPIDVYRFREVIRSQPKDTRWSSRPSWIEYGTLGKADIELRLINRNGSRQITNVNETLWFAKEFLELRGLSVHYHELFMENLGTPHQWNGARADIIITSHGAQEMNMIGADKCTAWLEIFPLGYLVPSYYGSMAEQYGILWYYYYDRDALAGKPECMVENPELDPDYPDGKVFTKGRKYLDARKCRRKAHIKVDLDVFGSILEEMLRDQRNCRKSGGLPSRYTDFEELTHDLQDLLQANKSSPDIIRMNMTRYYKPVDYLD